jgi:hypothetical protein
LLEEAGILIEAREFQGVRRVSWKEVMASGERVDLFRVKGLTAEAEKVVLEFLWEQMGKPYDYTMVARFISRRQEERESSGKWFCSELVFAALAKAGVKLLERIEPWAVSPGVLALSPRLEEVQAGCTGGPMRNAQRPGGVMGRTDMLGNDSPLTPALSPLRGEGDYKPRGLLGVSPDRVMVRFGGGRLRTASPTYIGEQAGRLRYGPRDAGATEKEEVYVR